MIVRCGKNEYLQAAVANGKYNYNKDAGMLVCPSGHMRFEKHVQERITRIKISLPLIIRYQKCEVCLMREVCDKEATKSGT